MRRRFRSVPQFLKKLRSADGRLTLVVSTAVMFVAAGSIIGGVLLQSQNTSAAGVPGSATITITAPAAAQPLNTPFDVTANLTQFTGGTAPFGATWGGYDLEVRYDPTLISVNVDANGFITHTAANLCQPANNWANPQTVPDIVTGCFGNSSTSTGLLEDYSLNCIANGVVRSPSCRGRTRTSRWVGRRCSMRTRRTSRRRPSTAR